MNNVIRQNYFRSNTTELRQPYKKPGIRAASDLQEERRGLIADTEFSDEVTKTVVEMKTPPIVKDCRESQDVSCPSISVCL